MLQSDNRERWGFGEVLRLSWPASLSMLNSTLMRFVDAVFVSYLGPEVSAAQFLAGICSFVPESFATGVLTVVNTYVSQNLGAGRHEKCGQYAWAGILIGLAFCCFVAPLALVAYPIFSLFPEASQTPEIMAMEVMYFRYMVLSIFFTLMSRPLEQFFYGIGRPLVVLGASITANLTNIVGDYILIFGKYGAPKLGLEGAAIATMGSWALLFVIMGVMFLSRGIHRRFGTRLVRAVRWEQARDLLRTGWPAGLQFFNDVLPWTIFTGAIVGLFGREHLEASTFAMRWMPLSFMPAVGIGIAATALVGRYIGEGKPEAARRRAHAALVVAMIYMGLCGVLFLLQGENMIRFFVKDTGPGAAEHVAEIMSIGKDVMICAAVFQLFDAIGIVFMGALRGAGDTFWPMAVTFLTSWLITVGGGYLAALLLPSLGSVGPWIAASLYVVVLGILLAMRFESGQWRKFDLLHKQKA